MAVRRLLLFLMAAGLLVAAASLPYRAWQMAGERRVEFAVSLSDARSFSAQHIFPLSRVLEAYRQAGVTTAAIAEKTLHDLTSEGNMGYPASFRVDIAVLSGLDVAADTRLALTPETLQPELDKVYIFVRDNRELADWIHRRLAVRLGAERVGRLPGPQMGASPGTDVITALAEKEWLFATPLGIFPLDVEAAVGAGLIPVFAFRQTRGMSTASPGDLFDGLPPGPQRILFTGDAVPGWPMDLTALGSVLRQRGDTLLLDYRRNAQTGQPIRVAGIVTMLEATGYRAVKVYRPWVGERQEDWVTAVKDRSMRFMLHPVEVLSRNADEDLEKQTATVTRLKENLEGYGFTIGQTGPTLAVTVPAWALLGAVLAIAAGGAWLVSQVAGPVLSMAALAAGLLGAGGALYLAPLPGRQVLAFAAALLFPVLGGLWALGHRRRGWAGMVETVVKAALPALAGGLLVHAILGETAFVLEMQLFKGVKAALLLPVLLLVAVMAVRSHREALGVATEAFESKVRAGHLLLLGTALALGLILLIRSTNQLDPTATAVQPTDLELRIRALLESLLVARPRFKEFAFGYPALALAAYFLQTGYSRWGQLLLAVGLVATTSVVNSFAHLHTPLYISLLRSLHGLWLGLLIGAAVYLLARILISPAAGRNRHA